MTQSTLEMDRLADVFSCQSTSCSNYSTLQDHIQADGRKAEIGGAQEFLPEGVTLTRRDSVPYGCRECPVAYINEVASQPGVEDIAMQNGTTTFRYNGHQYQLSPKGIKPVGSSNGWVRIKDSQKKLNVEETIACIR